MERFYEILGAVGGIAGILSLAGIIWGVAVWKGQVDSDRAAWREMIKNYPLAEMNTMVKTLWDVCVVAPLHQRPDLARRGSGFKLTPTGEGLIPPDIKNRLTSIPGAVKNKEDIVSGYTVVLYLGMETIEEASRRMGLNIQETVAVLSTYLDNTMHNGHSATPPS